MEYPEKVQSNSLRMPFSQHDVYFAEMHLTTLERLIQDVKHSVRDRVLATPGLLELILLQLPPRQLLTTGIRLSRSYYKFITESPPLQKALFFRTAPNSIPTHATSCWTHPSSNTNQCTENDRHQYQHQPNPISKKLSRPFFPPLKVYSYNS